MLCTLLHRICKLNKAIIIRNMLFNLEFYGFFILVLHNCTDYITIYMS